MSDVDKIAVGFARTCLYLAWRQHLAAVITLEQFLHGVFSELNDTEQPQHVVDELVAQLEREAVDRSGERYEIDWSQLFGETPGGEV